jgi:hypothetical protein
LAVVVLAFAVVVHFVVSGAVAGFPIEVISKGRSWIFLGGYLVAGYVGLILLGLARRRFEPGDARPLEPVASTRVVSKNVDEVPPNSDEDVDDGV